MSTAERMPLNRRLGEKLISMRQKRERVPFNVQAFGGRIVLMGADSIHTSNPERNIDLQAGVVERRLLHDSDGGLAYVRPVISETIEDPRNSSAVRVSEMLAEKLDDRGVQVIYDEEPARLPTNQLVIPDPYKVISESITHMRDAPEVRSHHGEQVLLNVMHPTLGERSFRRIEQHHLQHGNMAELVGAIPHGAGRWEQRL